MGDVQMYDALVSLIQELELMSSSHNRMFGSDKSWSCSCRKEDIQILYDDVCLMDSLLIDSSGENYDYNLMSNLENEILSAVHDAQDFVDSCVYECCSSDPNTEKQTGARTIDPRLHSIIKYIDSIHKSSQTLPATTSTGLHPHEIWEQLCSKIFVKDSSGQVSNIEKQTNVINGAATTVDSRFLHSVQDPEKELKKILDDKEVLPKAPQILEDNTPAGDSFTVLNLICRTLNKKGNLVGREKDRLTMLDRLTGQPSELKVLAVTGTVGIGKTTFTKRLYDDPLVMDHFYIRAWLTILPHYQVREVLIGLIDCVTDFSDDINKQSTEQLRKQLKRSLKGVRYIIVLDDMWDNHAWDDLKTSFPDDKNGSRILLTSSLRDIAIHASPDTPPHCLSFLSLDESWELLCSHIESCPVRLVRIGMNIALLCRGLPLAIVLIGWYLSNMNKTFEIWKEVVSALTRGVILDDAEQALGNLPCSNMETQINVIDGKATAVNSSCLQSVQEQIVSIKKKLKILDDREVVHKAPQNLQDATSAGDSFTVLNLIRRTPNEGSKLVGHEKDLLTMLDHLTGEPPKLKVFAVTGMAGIGKTTFTKKLYDHPYVMYHFHCRAWFTVSQQYQVREMLIGLLHCVTDLVTEINERSNEDLREQLYKSLKGKRYLIVLDDMWDNRAWDYLKIIFPDDMNGSRILLTSRLTDVAIHASPDTPPHCLSFLSSDESWELLCSKIFMKESCPIELEPIGKQIACKCHGLPLAIVVVGGLLSKMNKTLEVWQEFVLSVSSLVMEKAENCKSILALSYNHLPLHLKVCFLYMAIFPEDYEIPVETLIRLWVAEGFIHPRKVKRLEEMAEDYLEDLMSRNLVMVRRRRPDGRPKICYIHDLLRDLCLTESQNQYFYRVFKSVEVGVPWEIQRRMCFHSNVPGHIISSSFPCIRSFLWFNTLTFSNTEKNTEKYLSMNFKLLKVLDIKHLHLEELPREILGLAHLRYLSVTFRNSFDRSIFTSTLHNLQILIIESDWNGQLPKEFWDMWEIRHLQFKRCFLSYWPNDSRPNILQLSSASKSLLPFNCQQQIAEHPLNVLQNLQSLTTIRPISCTKNVFLSMPNLKKLGIYENEEDSLFRGWFRDLIYLQELQTLKYIFSNPFVSPLVKPDPLPSWEFFPPMLTKLTLSGTSLPWEDMIKLSELPNLEVLKLKNYAFSGAIWESEEGGFSRLKYLLIGRTNLQIWEADGSHFPNLQHLVMMYCRSLKEIPCSFGDAPLLEKIELHNCSEYAATSAEQIRIEQQNNGNDGLTVHISNDW